MTLIENTSLEEALCSDCAGAVGDSLQSGRGSCDLRARPDCEFEDWRGFGDLAGNRHFQFLIRRFVLEEWLDERIGLKSGHESLRYPKEAHRETLADIRGPISLQKL